jgi:hypothetical protein
MFHTEKPVLLAALGILTLTILTLGATDASLGDDNGPIKLTLHPAAAPAPVGKYRLLPGRLEQIPGNATVFYGKVKAEEQTFFGQPNLIDKLDQWQEMPLAELRKAKVSIPHASLFFLMQGAKCRFCDWQLPIGQLPYYEILLPDVQESRTFSRMLAAQARLEIAEGKFDDAMKTFQSNYALARNVAEGETIVNGLVGVAMCGIMLPQVTEFIQQPGSPNLYWALTMLPTPMIDMQTSVELESMGMELTFPELKDMLSARRTDDEWGEIFRRFSKEVTQFLRTGREEVKLPSADKLDEACQEAARKMKGMLIQGGKSAKDVQAMSVHQLALLRIMQLHHELLDDGIKYYSLPYPQAIAGINAAIRHAKELEQNGEQILPVSSSVLAAIESARSASARADRGMAALRTIEALRIYADSHEGNLPEQLADITDLPIPDDPVTGQPFAYTLDGERAYLHGPKLKEAPLDFEITMARTK